MYKKCRVVMLPTKEKSILFIGKLSRHLHILTNPYMVRMLSNGQESSTKCQHLYILSDEEIKEGDWIINGNIAQDNNCIRNMASKDMCEGFSKIALIMSHNDATKNVVLTKKIIASTNTQMVGDADWLPQLPQSFIDKYVSEYNKGNIIADILVEYKQNKKFAVPPNELKVNPKDNTITIKGAKDSWTKREVIELFVKYNLENKDHSPDKDLFEWIKDNL